MPTYREGKEVRVVAPQDFTAKAAREEAEAIAAIKADNIPQPKLSSKQYQELFAQYTKQQEEHKQRMAQISLQQQHRRQIPTASTSNSNRTTNTTENTSNSSNVLKHLDLLRRIVGPNP